MTLLEAGLNKENFNILGTDINSTILKKAKEGIYSDRSVKFLDENILNRYFGFNGTQYSINSSVKQMANFELNSIFELAVHRKYDFIFCRNLLIYFDKESIKKAMLSLISVLADGGKIFLGHGDFITDDIGLSVTYIDGIKCYEKKLS